MSPVLAAIAIGLGASLVTVGLLLRARERDDELVRVLDLPYGERDARLEERSSSFGALLEPGVAFAHAALERFKLMQRVSEELVRARVPIRPGEFVVVTCSAAVTTGAAGWLLTSQPLIAAMLAAFVFPVAWALLKRRSQRRARAFEMQLPEALSLISSSLEAGHTFLHSVEMMVEESEAPLSEEFERVLAETRLGTPLVDALQAMSDRLQVGDLAWMVQAIRIQQSVGGKLADLLATLAEFMRAREEVRREVRVLTAEGRLSGIVLGLLPIAVFMVIRTSNPRYLDPMLHGGGLVALCAAGVSVLAGLAWIRRMAKVEV